MSVKQWATNKVAEFIRNGSIAVSPENYKAREVVCLGCELYGKVEPVPGVILDGCTECGCPTATKAKMLMIVSEAVATVINLAAKPGHEVKTGEIMTCPHPTKGNLWEKADNKFKNQ